MAQVSFGTILRNERERKGYDLSMVARRLRIRPDILQSIEAGDFSRMPPRGYARNMVNAYARFLALNPTEITRMYLDEAYAEQVKKARENVRPTGFDMSSAPGNRRINQDRDSLQDNNMRYDDTSGRMVYAENNTSRYRNNREVDRVYSEERMHRSTRSAVPGAQYTNFYAGPKASGSLVSRLPLIIGGIVILLLIAVLLFYFFGPKPTSSDGVQNVPVTGVEDPEQTGGNEAADTETKPVEVAPDKIVFTYEVLDGQESWIDIYLNDESTPDGSKSGLMTGPTKASFDVTGKLTLTTANPAALKVYLDGVAAELIDPESDGIWSITVDYPTYLVQWNKDHPPTPSTDTGSTTATGSTAEAGTTA